MRTPSETFREGLQVFVRVFLDTNVIVSAFATRGLCADVLRLILIEHTLLSGDVVLEEVERVLSSKFGALDSVIQEILDLLRRHHVEPKPEKPTPLPKSDPDDQWILASAICADSDVLITGDSDLLDLTTEVQRPVILDPREFWNLLRDQVETP